MERMIGMATTRAAVVICRSMVTACREANETTESGKQEGRKSGLVISWLPASNWTVFRMSKCGDRLHLWEEIGSRRWRTQRSKLPIGHGAGIAGALCDAHAAEQRPGASRADPSLSNPLPARSRPHRPQHRFSPAHVQDPGARQPDQRSPSHPLDAYAGSRPDQPNHRPPARPQRRFDGSDRPFA